MIKNILGWILIFEAGFLLIPTLGALIYREEALGAFAASVGICLAAGGLLVLKKPDSTVLYAREGFVIVAFSWITLSLFGALPYYMSGVIPSYTDALFETVSGFTTTGATILGDVESLPRAVILWRSFTHWVGGMGVLVFIMAFVSLSGGQNMHIMKAESPGPSVSKLVPKVKTTAMILYSIYLVLTLAEFVSLLIGGMSVFEALNTAVATAGTGGFGFRNDSMASFPMHIQVTVTVFMLLFSVNFSCYYLFITGKFKDALNSELKVFAFMVLAAITVITLNIRSLYPDLKHAVNDAAFTVASIVSTTGFSTADFNLWPELSKTVIVLIMFVGACAGSTGGGIKVSRIMILLKGFAKELEVMIHPRQIKKISIDKRPVEHEVVRSVNSYVVCYIVIFTASLLIVSFDNYDFITNFTAVSACLNNIGPGLELVGPSENFAFLASPTKAVLIFDMLAGRLELFPILMLFSPATWKK